MKVYDINLKEHYSFLQGGNLQCQLMSPPWDFDDANAAWKRPALIVVPGGGYGMCSNREADPIATAFMAKGFQTFVLTYLCAPDNVRYPEQLLELSAAVDYVKKHADEMRVNAEEVFVVGFSAGGHLTANLAVDHQNASQKAGVALDCKPTAVGLGYAVISKTNGHPGSYANLLQGYTDEEKAELMKVLSLENVVSEHTPPAFIWATATDSVVPAENSLRYAMALGAQGISYELHIYPRGAHGYSTASKEICEEQPDMARVAHWVSDCAAYFQSFIIERM